MALRRRGSSNIEGAVWPGFVDAMSSLLLVLMFVLTIFTVMQFVLSDTISGQKSELSELTAQVANLTDALGLSESRVAALDADLSAAGARETAQIAQITQLTRERDETRQNLAQAETRITGFEAQVAGLLADRSNLQEQVAGLETAQTRLMTEAEALNLALASARDEIDLSAEQARLAAAKADAMEALIASLEQDVTAGTQALAEADAQRVLDQAAAEALRARLMDAGAEMTAMTLALEEQRREAEETLTLLAAAEAARSDLDIRLADALATAALAEAARAADLEAATEAQSDLEQRLAAALLAQQAAEARLDATGEAAAESAVLQSQIRDLLAQLATAEGDASRALSAAETQAALLATANARLSEEEALSAESLREVQALTQQVTALRNQVAGLQQLLDLADSADAEADVRIDSLSQQLNTALARAAAEERRARMLEEAEAERLREEAARLTAETENLERYRSEFFGRLRDVLDGQEGIRVVGDRFVFSSEVLFAPGSATLSPEGETEIARAANLLRQIADEIPDTIDWVIQVDGHTDNVPLSGTGEFRDNWELSQARALSVVRYMTGAEDIPAARLSANGFGEFQPLVPMDTPEARALNRRIELKLTER